MASMDRLACSVVDLDQLVTRLTEKGVTVRFLKETLTFQAEAPQRRPRSHVERGRRFVTG